MGAVAASLVFASFFIPTVSLADDKLSFIPAGDPCISIESANVSAAPCCIIKTWYETHDEGQLRMSFPGMPIFKNGPGGSVTGEYSKSSTVSASVSVGGEVDIDAVLVSVKASVSTTLAKSYTVGVVIKYTHPISANKFGNLQYVSFGKRIGYKHYRLNRNCSTTLLNQGVVNYPTNSLGWYFWESNS